MDAGLDPSPQRRPPHSEPRPHWLHYSGHLTDFRSVEHPAARAMGILAAVLAPAALLTLIVPLAHAAAVRVPGLAGRIPVIVLFAGAAAQAMGWWYLLAGTALTSRLLRWLTAIAFIAVQGFAFDPVAPGAALACVVLTGAFAAMPQRILLSDRRVMLAAGLVVLLSLAAVWAYGAGAFAAEVLGQRVFFFVVALPMIVYSGVELGETGLLLTRLGLWHLHPRITPATLWWVAVGLVAAKAVYMFHSYPNNLVVAGLCLLLAGGAWLMRTLKVEGEPPSWVVMLSALLFFLGVDGMSVVETAVLVTGASLLLLARWKGPSVATVGVYLILMGLWLASGATEYAFDESVTIAALAYLVHLRFRGPLKVERVMLVVFWVAGFTVINGTYDALNGIEHLASGAPAATALLLIVALVHDIATSGGLLNAHSALMPRPARLLMYLGYVLLTSGAVVLSQGFIGKLSFQFGVSQLQLSGLYLFGVPLYVHQFLHAFSAGHHQRSDGATSGATPR